MTEICDASNAKDLRSAIIAACAMLLTFAAVAVPVPLYAEYKIALGLTDADISLTMVSYLTGVLIVLMMLNAILLPLAQETVTQRITIRKAIKPLVRIPKNLRPVFPLAAGCYIAAWGHRRVLPIAVNPCRRDVFPIHRPADPRAHVCAGHGPQRAGRAHVRPHHHAIRRIRRHSAAVHQLRDLVGYAHERHNGAVPHRRRRVQRFHRHPPVRQHAYAHQLQRPR